MSARNFFGRSPPLSVSAGNIVASGVNSPAGNQSSTVDGSSTAAPFGGVSPYTYSWSIVTQSGATITLSGATTATVTASRTGTPGVSTATLRVTVTDAIGATATFDISVTITLESGL